MENTILLHVQFSETYAREKEEGEIFLFFRVGKEREVLKPNSERREKFIFIYYVEGYRRTNAFFFVRGFEPLAGGTLLPFFCYFIFSLLKKSLQCGSICWTCNRHRSD